MQNIDAGLVEVSEIQLCRMQVWFLHTPFLFASRYPICSLPGFDLTYVSFAFRFELIRGVK